MEVEQPSKRHAAELRAAVCEKYRAVSASAEGLFPYPVGRPSAEGLGYESDWLDAIPANVVDHFVGVGNPCSIRRPSEGQCVLDLGCGSGLDVFVASLLVGPTGSVVGLDLSPDMLAGARRQAVRWPLKNLEFVTGLIEDMPFETSSFDLVLSNGVLNLVPDKEAAFRETRRVLKPAGTLAVADLLVTESVPAEVLADVEAWST